MKQNAAIGIIVFNPNILPEVGETFEVKDMGDATYPKRLGIELSGLESYAVKSDALLDQVSGIISGDEFHEMVGDFKNNTVTGTVKSVNEVTAVNGATNYIVTLDCEIEPIKKPVKAQKEESSIITLECKGAISIYPKKGEVLNLIKDNKELTEPFRIGKQKGILTLFYGEDAIGDIKDAPKAVLDKLKSIDDDTKFDVKYNSYHYGLFAVDVNLDDLKIDISNEFTKEENYAKSVGVSKEEFDQYVNLMVNVYGLPVKLTKLIINSWTAEQPDYASRYVPLERICATDKKGNIHPLYIDNFDNVKRCATYVLSGKTNINLKGEASVGKNILIETLAGLFRKPLLRESLSGGSDTGVLLGDQTVDKDGSIGFNPSQLIKAAEDGCWIILDEINTVQVEYLTVLHSLLEPDNRSINVPFYKYVKADPSFRVFATMNPVDSGEYVGTKELNSATASRFKTIEIQSSVTFEDVLKNACPQAPATEIKAIARVYNAIKKIYDSRAQELSSGFLAIRRYISILDDDIANEFLTLKERTKDSLIQANPNDRIQSEIVAQTINDCIQ